MSAGNPTRGDSRDGLVFWAMQGDREVWVTTEKFKQYKEREKVRRSKEIYLRKNRERAKIYERENKEKLSRRRRKYYIRNREKILRASRIYDKKNKKTVSKRKAKYQRERRATDPLYALKCRARTRISNMVRANGYKRGKTLEVLGCDWETFKLHIENSFSDGMSWDNFPLWHVDHIIPLASAKTEEELLSLFHYKNTQALWAKDNLKKGSKIYGR